MRKIIWELAFLFSRRKTLFIKPTMRCNLDCPYCAVVLAPSYYKRKYEIPNIEELPPDWWINLIRRTRPSRIGISGGEPGLYKGLHEIVNYAIRHRILVQIMTNLTAVEEYRKINKTWRVYLLFTLHPGGTMKYFNEMYRKFHITKRVLKKQPSRKTRYEKKLIFDKMDDYVLIYNPDGQLFDSCDSSSIGSNQPVTNHFNEIEPGHPSRHREGKTASESHDDSRGNLDF